MIRTPIKFTPIKTVSAPAEQVVHFPRAARVCSAADYARVFATGRRISSPLLALHWLCSQAPPRLGLAVSRKVDPHAVGRNRIKRQWREQFRQLRGQLPGGDYVLVARAAAAQAGNTELRDQLIAILRQAGALPAVEASGTMAAVSVTRPVSDSAVHTHVR